MRNFYFWSAVVVTIIILVFSFAQVGVSCAFQLMRLPTYFTLLIVGAWGMIVGGLFMLWWKQPMPNKDDSEDDEGEASGAV